MFPTDLDFGDAYVYIEALESSFQLEAGAGYFVVVGPYVFLSGRGVQQVRARQLEILEIGVGKPLLI